MLKYSQVIEIHAGLFDTAIVIDRYQAESGEMVTDHYECGTDEELSSVLEALGVSFEGTTGK